MAIYLLATLDTKGDEARWVRDRLEQLAVHVSVIDVGCLGQPAYRSDVTREQIFEAAGTTLLDVQNQRDRGEAVRLAALGAARLLAARHAEGDVDGVLGLGGSAGTTIATAAMRALPIGVPKLMVSTMASGQVRNWVGDKDVAMLNSIVDIAGLNRISCAVLNAAAAAMAGMVQYQIPTAGNNRPLIAATMFGVTTPCVQLARQLLEQEGFEVLVFHATGTGGQAMESLVRDGLIAGVLDITTTELADELVGGILSAGPHRLEAAATAGVPQVVSVGALDMVNFGPPETVPALFSQRKFYRHNPNVTLMRTTVDENRELGRQLADKVARSTGPATILLPSRGVSAIDADGQPFDDPTARQTLFEAIRSHAGPVPIDELPHHINDPEFAEAAVRHLMAMIGKVAAEE